ncbi:MAG TPA: homoserine O-succinyltransferase [Bryobacteraceae bacterium]|nr:homoserine O-succinyltransferase [Bryobacteraceae bacterium]
MPALLDRNPSFDASQVRNCDPQGSSAEPIRIGLLNNMPDAALEATERQFLSLLNVASGSLNVSLSLYTLPGIPRTTGGQQHVDQSYRSLEDLLRQRIDGLIVTGTEPRHPNLAEEPYWPNLTRVIDWAAQNTYSTVWSCLAAHAAVLHLDGIRRRRLKRKRFGVIKCTRVVPHELTAGLPPAIMVPHSRWNDIRSEDLTDRGYQILTRANGSLDAFVKHGKSLFVFFQGHPEYEENTLLLEYRRDVGRYVRRERDNYPLLPRNYFTREALGRLARLGEQILSERREEILAEFTDAVALQPAIAKSWKSAGVCIYGNWLAHVHAEKMRALKSSTLWKESAA